MELISIGEAARRLRLNTSALRYYEERGLVRPAARHAGRRMYGRTELRRLALNALIERAQGARRFLSAALTCPAEHPTSECPHLVGVLDRLSTGGTVEELAEEHSD
ncbi:MerR family transcriptional regulator [Nonomuraea angiospora]|uniref:MerR family transcriptional regulator n=1 Tax=Nonomuraea angiospora TaxID=46172 RepID=UPI003330F197